MSNLQPDSVIACLDSPNHIQAILNASMWAAKMLNKPIGLLHSAPISHNKHAIDYSCCLTGDDSEHILTELTHEDKINNIKLRDQGRELLKQADEYCQKKQGRYEHKLYTLHRHATIPESLSYVHDSAQLIVLGHQLTCKNSLAQLVRASKCPALITHEVFKTPKTALFAFDNKPTCHALLDWLCSNNLARHLTLHVVMIGKENTSNKDALREAYARLKQSGIDCKKTLIDGHDITASLLYYQQKHELDLLISGAFGESRIRELIHGSDTQKLLRKSRTPYLLFPKV